MSDAARQRMTPEEFFAWHEQQEERYELVDGVPVLKFDNGPEMMAGATESHDQIVVNLITALHSRLRGGPCRAKTADQATRTTARTLRVPDVTVDCGPRRPESFECSEPTVLFEVLSPSTRRNDLIRKLNEYQALPTLKHFAFIDPGELWVTLWSRQAGEAWRSDLNQSLDDTVELPGIGVSLPMTEIYEDVELSGD